MTTPLIQALPLIEGEMISGYVSRNAQLFETTSRVLCSDLGMRWTFLCSGYDDQIEQLAWFTGESLEMLRNWRTQKVGTAMCDDDRKDLEKLIAQISDTLDEGQKDRLLNAVNTGDGSEGKIAPPLLERLRPILEVADKLGKADPDFDLKVYLDEMWGDI